MITIRNLRKSYWLDGKEIPVLRGIDLDVARGERISIIGRSGSGKSTFLHVLGTLDVPSAGTVHFDAAALGRGGAGSIDVFAQRGHALAAFRNKTIGFVFQFHHLLPEFTALENVMMPAMIQRMPVDASTRRATAMLEVVGLGHRLHHRPGELSGGEQQRVALARALVHRPRLILADEPTGNLDPRTGGAALALIEEQVRAHGAALLMVTHSAQAAAIAQRRLRLTPAGLEEAP
jgi:lipoprotein-releasing system ATP-binding protein